MALAQTDMRTDQRFLITLKKHSTDVQMVIHTHTITTIQIALVQLDNTLLVAHAILVLVLLGMVAIRLAEHVIGLVILATTRVVHSVSQIIVTIITTEITVNVDQLSTHVSQEHFMTQ